MLYFSLLIFYANLKEGYVLKIDQIAVELTVFFFKSALSDALEAVIAIQDINILFVSSVSYWY